MVWSKDYRISAVQYDDGTLRTISGISDGAIEANAEIRQEVGSGSVYAPVASVDKVAPVARFTTRNLPAAFQFLGVEGKCVDTGTGFIVWAQRQACAGPDSGSVHRKYHVPKGVLTPQQLTVDHRGDATMSYQVNARYDGTNQPVYVTTGQALPAITGDDLRYTMHENFYIGIGDVDGGNADWYGYHGKRNISLDFNAQVSSEGADSNTFDSVQSLSSMLSSVNVRGVNLEWFQDDDAAPANNADNVNPLSTGRILHQVAGNTNEGVCRFFLKERNSAVTDAVHVRIDIYGLIYWNTILTGGIQSPLESAFAIAMTGDNTNKPIVVTRDVAITTPTSGTGSVNTPF